MTRARWVTVSGAELVSVGAGGCGGLQAASLPAARPWAGSPRALSAGPVPCRFCARRPWLTPGPRRAAADCLRESRTLDDDAVPGVTRLERQHSEDTWRSSPPSVLLGGRPGAQTPSAGSTLLPLSVVSQAAPQT